MIILSVGAPIVAKGWLDLLDALKEVKKNNGEFVLLGIYGGHSSLDLEQEAKNRGLADNFMYISDVPPDKMNQYYNAADIFCLASHTEGIANAVTEAMACGLPVITTSVGGHPELITDNENGILTEPKNVPALSRKLQELILQEDLRIKLGKNAREHIVANWGNFADNSKKLYDILQNSIG
jgi:glycosyltransferase involved in cell wall biosynthesis